MMILSHFRPIIFPWILGFVKVILSLLKARFGGSHHKIGSALLILLLWVEILLKIGIWCTTVGWGTLLLERLYSSSQFDSFMVKCGSSILDLAKQFPNGFRFLSDQWLWVLHLIPVNLLCLVLHHQQTSKARCWIGEFVQLCLDLKSLQLIDILDLLQHCLQIGSLLVVWISSWILYWQNNRALQHGESIIPRIGHRLITLLISILKNRFMCLRLLLLLLRSLILLTTALFFQIWLLLRLVRTLRFLLLNFLWVWVQFESFTTIILLDVVDLLLPLLILSIWQDESVLNVVGTLIMFIWVLHITALLGLWARDARLDWLRLDVLYHLLLSHHTFLLV